MKRSASRPRLAAGGIATRGQSSPALGAVVAAASRGQLAPRCTSSERIRPEKKQKKMSSVRNVVRCIGVTQLNKQINRNKSMTMKKQITAVCALLLLGSSLG